MTTNKTSIQSAHESGFSLAQHLPGGSGMFDFGGSQLGSLQHNLLAAAGGGGSQQYTTPPGSVFSADFSGQQHVAHGHAAAMHAFTSGGRPQWSPDDENALPPDGLLAAGGSAAAFQPTAPRLDFQSAAGGYTSGSDPYGRLPADSIRWPPSSFSNPSRTPFGLQQPASQHPEPGPQSGASRTVQPQAAYYGATTQDNHVRAPASGYRAPPFPESDLYGSSRSQTPPSYQHVPPEASFEALAAQQHAQRYMASHAAADGGGFGQRPDGSHFSLRGDSCEAGGVMPAGRQLLSRQRAAPAPGPAPDSSAKRLQARRTVYVCDIDPEVMLGLAASCDC